MGSGGRVLENRWLWVGFSSLSVHFSGESVILVGFSSLSVHFFWLWFDGWVLVNRW